MKSNIILGFFGLFSLLMSCGGGTSSAPKAAAGTGDFTGFEMSDYSNTGDMQLARQYDADKGHILSEGPVKDGGKEGAWLTYHTGRDTGKIKTVTNYHNNQQTGVFLEFSTNGSISKRVDYDAGVIHGIYAEYKYNRPMKYAEYQKGELHGLYKTFYNSGKPQQITAYTNGKKNGTSEFYNEDGHIIMKYEYKNDEKVSGGKVTPPTSQPAE